jgi:hypothetical protein
MRAQICSTGWFDQNKIQTTMKMLSLMKFRIIDHEFCVCEYGLCPFPSPPPLVYWRKSARLLSANVNSQVGLGPGSYFLYRRDRMSSSTSSAASTWYSTTFVRRVLSIILHQEKSHHFVYCDSGASLPLVLHLVCRVRNWTFLVK